jgi:hypothetical protein
MDGTLEIRLIEVDHQIRFRIELQAAVNDEWVIEGCGAYRTGSRHTHNTEWWAILSKRAKG